MKYPVALSTLAVILCVSPGAMAAQGTISAEDKELRAYQLTMPAMKQALEVMRRVAESLESDPRFAKAAKLEAEIEKLSEKDELTDAEAERLEKLQEELEAAQENSVDDVLNKAKTLNEMAALLQKEPVYAKALSAVGMSARDFAKFWLSYVQTAFAYGFLKAGTIKQVPDEVNPANIKFFQDHEKEIDALMKSAQPSKKPQG